MTQLNQRLSRAYFNLDTFINVHQFSLMLLIAFIYVVFSMNMPVSIYTLAGHDDGLFLKHAYSIAKGNWLGAYTQMTLAKGSGFPIFLAINAATGIPITLTLAIFYIFSSWLLSTRLISIGLPSVIGLILFCILLFHPQTFPTRIIRDNIYPGLSLILVAALIDIFLLNRRNFFRMFLYGIAGAMFWITREEGIWIIPGAIFFIALQCLFIWKTQGLTLIKKLFIPNLIFMGTALFFIFIVCCLNYYKYGAFVTVDFKEKYFAKSLSLLNSIEPSQRTLHVPVNAEQRELAYKVSPAFATLEKYFKQDGLNWTRPGCNVYKYTCGDYAGGWFMWAYRDAVANQGLYISHADATNFYRKVAEEVSAACSTGKISCRSHVLGFLPNLSIENIEKIPGSLNDTYRLLMVSSGVHIDGGPSMDRNDTLRLTRFFLRHPLSTPSIEENKLQLYGWYYDSSSTDSWIDLNCSNQEPTAVERKSSPDLVSAMKDTNAHHQRFFIEHLSPENCTIVSKYGKSVSLIDLISKKSGPVALGPDATLYIDFAHRGVPEQIKQIAIKIKTTLSSIYKVIMPVLFWFGLIFLVAALTKSWKIRSLTNPLLFVALTAWALVATRIAILVLIDISAFPAINGLYMGPGFPLLTTACVTSIASFFTFNLSIRNL